MILQGVCSWKRGGLEEGSPKTNAFGWLTLRLGVTRWVVRCCWKVRNDIINGKVNLHLRFIQIFELSGNYPKLVSLFCCCCHTIATTPTAPPPSSAQLASKC